MSKTVHVPGAELREGVSLQAGVSTLLVVEGADGAPGEQPAATPKPPAPEPVLRDARWLAAEHAHGDQAVMEIAAEHAEGRALRFIVERKEGSGWQPHATASGRVEGGKARAQIAALHPRHEDGDPFADAPAAELRFRVELA